VVHALKCQGAFNAGDCGNPRGYFFVMLIHLVGWLNMRGEAHQKCSFSACREADMFVVKFIKY